MKTPSALLILFFTWTASGATVNNDESCDIAVAPAATLPLPFFAVNLDDPHGATTAFAVTNAGPEDRIARVTLWTDLAFPAMTVDLALDGYGVQSINLYDVIGRGVLAQSCGERSVPLDRAVLERLQSVFLGGDDGACNDVGHEHLHAVGYATIDLVRNCSANSPMTLEYWTSDIAWDNVLIGDSEQIDSTNHFAHGSPLVHIRAIPEGGTLAQRLALPQRLPRTFYARFQPATAPGLDGRQPLPSVFAARWIDGGGSAFRTGLKIWREGTTGREATCAMWHDNMTEFVEIVRFDDAENAFPHWVVTSMRAEGRYSVDLDAAALGNGWTPPAGLSEVTKGTETIGPRP